MPTAHFSNLCVGNDPTSILMYSVLTSLAVSVVAQKYGGDSPSHLQRCRYYQFYRFTLRLWQHICKIPSLTDANISPFLSRSQKERSSIERKAFDLCRMAAISDIFSCSGGLSLMSPHSTICACLVLTFSTASLAKCASAFGDNED